MKAQGVALEDQQVREQHPRVSIIEAYKQSPRAQRAIIVIVLVYILATAVAYLFTWIRHDIPLLPGIIAFIMLSMLFVLIIFYLFFQKPNRVPRSLVNTVPLLVYFFVYFTVVVVVLEMNWYVDGMTQVALIGTFVMMPVVLVSAVRLVWDYT